MTYEKYLKCAYKHLTGCKQIIKEYDSSSKQNWSVLLELYYLSGYILEGIIVYAVYRSNGWEEKRNIKEFDEEFVKRTKLDFYKQRKNVNKLEVDYTIESHRFNDIVQGKLIKGSNNFNGIPYIGDGPIDETVEQLIEDWCPDVRYWHFLNKNKNISKDNIEKLINTCDYIYKNIGLRI